jgi:hypothetical protein
MVELSRSVAVDAPPSVVFEFLDVPANQVAVTPGLAAVDDVEPLPNGGKRLSYTYRMAGLDVTGRMETPTYDPPRRVVFALTEGVLGGEIEWLVEPVDDADGDADGDEGADGDGDATRPYDRTRFTYRADYRLPSATVERVAAPLVARYNERQLAATVENVRARFADGRLVDADGNGDGDASTRA